jgi:proline iminopeptidase
VLINGGPGSTHHCFHPWLSRAKDFARLIYYDQRGCGLSAYNPGDEGYSVDQAVADLDALRKALGIDRWVVLGYSYGGFLAQYYALKHPDCLSGLILLGAGPGMWVEMKPGRQYDFLSAEEKASMREIQSQLQKLAGEQKWSDEKLMALLFYNNHLNGDWKRQHFYRPSRERLAQAALFEWNFDLRNNFRGGISNSLNKIDMTGAFVGCPVPTLILEGQWDLTWNTDKPEILAKNHPGAKLILFENAGHGIYDEDPDRFFSVVNDYIRSLPRVSLAAITAYEDHVAQWDRKQKASPFYIVRSAGYGRSSMANLAKSYKREWCDVLDEISLLLKMGFAQYETANYDEGFYVFERMQWKAEKKEQPGNKAVALIWQGHMLDLLGKRPEAIACYRQAADMNLRDSWVHSQYGLQYEVSSYARERMEKPFVRVENEEIEQCYT